jgi:hypothetical protein
LGRRSADASAPSADDCAGGPLIPGGGGAHQTRPPLAKDGVRLERPERGGQGALEDERGAEILRRLVRDAEQ